MHFCTKGFCTFVLLIFCTLEHKDVAQLNFSAKKNCILELLSRKLLYSLHLFIFLEAPTVDLTVTEQLSPFVSYSLVGDQVQKISFQNISFRSKTSQKCFVAKPPPILAFNVLYALIRRLTFLIHLDDI